MPDPDFTVDWRIRDWRLDMEPNTPYPKPDAGVCSFEYTGYCTPHPTPHARDDLTYVLEPHKDTWGNDNVGWVYTRCPAHQNRWAAAHQERATA
jgi:hypothetical protein